MTTTTHWHDGNLTPSDYLLETDAATTYVPYTGATGDVDIGANGLKITTSTSGAYEKTTLKRAATYSGYLGHSLSLDTSSYPYEGELALKTMYLYNGYDNFVQIYSSAYGGLNSSIEFSNVLGGNLSFSFAGNISISKPSGEALYVNGTTRLSNKLSLGHGFSGNADIYFPDSQYTIPTAYGDGDMWREGGLLVYQNGAGSGGTLYPRTISTVVFAQTNTVTVANTTTETSLKGTGKGNSIIYGGMLSGRTVEIEAEGTMTNTGTPTLQIRFKLWGTTIVDTSAVTMVTLSGTRYWKAKAKVTCRTTGVSGTVIGQGDFTYDNSTAPVILADNNTSTTTVTTYNNMNVDVTAQWGTANVSNSISCTNLIIKYY